MTSSMRGAAAVAYLLAGLMIAPGCLCQRGISLRGGWSLEVEKLPANGVAPGCASGCDVRSAYDGAMPRLSASQPPVVPPPFQTVPTGPILVPEQSVAENLPDAEPSQQPLPPSNPQSKQLPGSTLSLKQAPSWIFAPAIPKRVSSASRSTPRPAPKPAAAGRSLQ